MADHPHQLVAFDHRQQREVGSEEAVRHPEDVHLRLADQPDSGLVIADHTAFEVVVVGKVRQHPEAVFLGHHAEQSAILVDHRHGRETVLEQQPHRLEQVVVRAERKGVDGHALAGGR